jgi:chromosomal replication initiator protein
MQQLRSDLSEQQFNTWIRPLQAVEDDLSLRLLAPNRFVVDWIEANCMDSINQMADSSSSTTDFNVVVEVGSRAAQQPATEINNVSVNNRQQLPISFIGGKLNPDYTFDRFVEGKSNQLARAAAMQVSRNPVVPTIPSLSTGVSASARPT